MTDQVIELERIAELPYEIQNIIFYFIPRFGTTQVIRLVIDTYCLDHNYYLTKEYKLFYVKNIISFSEYFYDTKHDDYDYQYGRKYFDSIDNIDNINDSDYNYK